MSKAQSQPLLTIKLFLLRVTVIAALSLCTFFIFHSQDSGTKYLINDISLINCLMMIWALVAVWVFYPLLASWQGRFVVLSGAVLLLLILMPTKYESQLLEQLSTVLQLTPLPKSWLDVTSLSTAGHFCAFFSLSVVSLSLFRQHFTGVFVLLLAAALLSELLQNFSISRNANLDDFAVNISGVLVAGVLVKLFYTKRMSEIQYQSQ